MEKVLRMGYVKVKVKIRNIHEPELEAEKELFADAGSVYTMIRRKFLEELHIKPRGNGSLEQRMEGLLSGRLER